jgi:prepilin-type N-terminal cleavage/methylation domain-containing protein
MFRDQGGTSLIEIMVALTILGVGLLGIAGATATVNRMLGQGRWATASMGYGERRLELLRNAARDSTSCAALTGGSATLPGGFTERWSVTPGIGSLAVEVVIAVPSRADTLRTVLACQ